MVQGSPRMMQVARRRWIAGGLGIVLFLALTAASGPADFPGQFDSGQIAASLNPSSDDDFPPPPFVADSTPLHAAATEQAGPELLHDDTAEPVTASLIITPSMIPRVQKSHTVWVHVTAYCSCKKCCGPGAHGVTSSGKPIAYNDGHFLAADLKLFPYGTRLIIPGYSDDNPVEVIDRGGAIRGYHIDIFMPTHEQAVDWGKKWLQVQVLD